MRAQHVVIALIFICAVPQGVVFASQGATVPGVGLLVLSALTLPWLALSRRGHRRLGGVLISVTFFVAIGAILLTRGGMHTHSAIYLLLTPVLGSMLVDRRHGLVIGLTTAVYLFSVWAAQVMGLQLEPLVPHEDEWMLVGIDYFGVAVSITMILWAQQGVWQRLVVRLDEVNTSLEAEAAVRLRAEETALAAARARSAFLATMSHELRTPLNGILGLTEVLLDEGLSDKQRHIASTVRDSGQLLRALLDDVLDFSKIDSGALDLLDEPLDLRSLCEEVAALWRAMAAERGLELSVDWAPDTPRWVSGDAMRLRQILGNLVSNAIKFTEEGSITIEARTDGAERVLAVRDTGVGIAPEALSRIFEPFRQADSSTTRRYGGTGLGLTICRRLAIGMGGSLSVSSAHGSGSAFTLRVPLSEVAAPPTQATDTRPSLAGLRVLVAEDNPINQLVIRLLLERQGVIVHLVSDGEQAIAAWEVSSPELILMDCQMPNCDGYEATRRLRLAGATTPIIAVTANSMLGDRVRCIKAGMDDHIGKPIHPAELEQVLQRWWGTPSQHTS